MDPSSAKTQYTYHLAKIPKVIGLHPLIKKKYDEKVGIWPKQKFLETPYISDQRKIAAIKMFDPEAADTLTTGVHYATKIDSSIDDAVSTTNKFGNKYLENVNKLKYNQKAQEQYKLHNWLNVGGRTRRKQIKRKKSKNNRKNKKRTRNQKY